MPPAASSLPTRSCTAGEDSPTCRASSAYVARPLARSRSRSCRSTASMAPTVLTGPATLLATVTEYSCGRTLGADEGVGRLAAFLVVLLVAVGVVVLLMRAATAASGGAGISAPRPPRTRSQRPQRPVAPDDDPDFLRELDRRRARDDGPTA